MSYLIPEKVYGRRCQSLAPPLYFCPVMLKRLVMLGLIILLLFLASACGPAERRDGGGLSGEEARGAAIYDRRCRSCHKVDGNGGKRGPDLTRIGAKRSARWLDAFLINPKDVDADNKMPQVFLIPEERRAVVKYLQTLD